jgi:dienelactone hydrolase
MTYSIVAVSGYSGGNKGPVGLYESLSKKYFYHDVKFHAIDTTADDIEVNIDKVIKAASESSHAFEKTYLMGYSMGGAVAALAAERMLLEKIGEIAGVILLSTQIDGLYPLIKNPIPTLFIHGTSDPIFQEWEIESVYKSCKGDKQLVWLKGLDHSWKALGQHYVSASYTDQLAQCVFDNIKSFDSALVSGEKASSVKHHEISMSILDRGVNRIARVFKSLGAIALSLLCLLQVDRKISYIARFLQDLSLG